MQSMVFYVQVQPTFTNTKFETCKLQIVQHVKLKMTFPIYKQCLHMEKKNPVHCGQASKLANQKNGTYQTAHCTQHVRQKQQ